MEDEKLVFGWVSPTVQGNYEAWSNWKDYGNEEDAMKFYQLTQEEAYEKGLTWFKCVDETTDVEG